MMRFAVLTVCCALIAHLSVVAPTNEPKTFEEATKGVSQKIFRILDVFETVMTDDRSKDDETDVAKSIADGFVAAVKPIEKIPGKFYVEIAEDEFMEEYKEHVEEPCAAIIGYMGHDGKADHYRQLCMQIDEIQPSKVFEFVRY